MQRRWLNIESSVAARYGAALFCVAVAVMTRGLLDPFLDDSLQFVTLFGAVAASVAVGSNHHFRLLIPIQVCCAR